MMKIASYIGQDKSRFAALVKCMFDKEQLLAQRAAWVFSDCAVNHPEMVKPYLGIFHVGADEYLQASTGFEK